MEETKVTVGFLAEAGRQQLHHLDLTFQTGRWFPLPLQ